MNKTLVNFLFILISLTVFPSMALSLEQKSDQDAPVVYLPSDTYNFDSVLEGVLVTHDFVIENRGNVPLQIINVQPGCGCTTASYTKEILPGKSGKISLTFNSAGYAGKSVEKRPHVETNDPTHASFNLTITGKVETFVQINPASAILKGSQSDEIKTEIAITPNKGRPFKILEVKTKEGKNISCELKETKAADGLQYILTVVNLSKDKGIYNDTIFLKTDSEVKPEIKIYVSGEIK